MTNSPVLSLSSELAALRTKFAKIVPPEVAAIMDAHINSLRREGNVDAVAKVGDVAPPFVLTNQHGAQVDSAELLKAGPLVVNFYRGVWCPYCSAEMVALDRAKAEIERRGARLVLISPQDPARRTPAVVAKLGVDLLYDRGNEIGTRFGLTYTFPAELRAQVYEGMFKMDIARENATTEWQLPIPARFVIGRDGTIVSAYADPDYRFRPDPLETLAVLDALR
jgi:peroxiredoxin